MLSNRLSSLLCNKCSFKHSTSWKPKTNIDLEEQKENHINLCTFLSFSFPPCHKPMTNFSSYMQIDLGRRNIFIKYIEIGCATIFIITSLPLLDSFEGHHPFNLLFKKATRKSNMLYKECPTIIRRSKYLSYISTNCTPKISPNYCLINTIIHLENAIANL